MAVRTEWKPIIASAAAWVEAQRFTVTLRQVFYYLVTLGVISNTEGSYKYLSSKTAEARRLGLFPELADGTRTILQTPAYADKSAYAADAAANFALDHTRDQKWQVVVGVEKRGMMAAAWEQFGGRGFRVVPLGGYSSATIDIELGRQLAEDAEARPSVLLYAGDFDATGEDIFRNFTEQVVFDEVIQVALTVAQVTTMGLPVNPGKETDSRAKAFAAKYGVNIQVEVDALDPTVLADLFEDAAAPYFDQSALDAVIEEEDAIRDEIREALS